MRANVELRYLSWAGMVLQPGDQRVLYIDLPAGVSVPRGHCAQEGFPWCFGNLVHVREERPLQWVQRKASCGTINCIG
jgi:hypothetical protein